MRQCLYEYDYLFEEHKSYSILFLFLEIIRNEQGKRISSNRTQIEFLSINFTLMALFSLFTTILKLLFVNTYVI